MHTVQRDVSGCYLCDKLACVQRNLLARGITTIANQAKTATCMQVSTQWPNYTALTDRAMHEAISQGAVSQWKRKTSILLQILYFLSNCTCGNVLRSAGEWTKFAFMPAAVSSNRDVQCSDLKLSVVHWKYEKKWSKFDITTNQTLNCNIHIILRQVFATSLHRCRSRLRSKHFKPGTCCHQSLTQINDTTFSQLLAIIHVDATFHCIFSTFSQLDQNFCAIQQTNLIFVLLLLR